MSLSCFLRIQVVSHVNHTADAPREDVPESEIVPLKVCMQSFDGGISIDEARTRQGQEHESEPRKQQRPTGVPVESKRTLRPASTRPHVPLNCKVVG